MSQVLITVLLSILIFGIAWFLRGRGVKTELQVLESELESERQKSQGYFESAARLPDMEVRAKTAEAALDKLSASSLEAEKALTAETIQREHASKELELKQKSLSEALEKIDTAQQELNRVHIDLATAVG